ncbi:MAG TPA: hypothetical protein VLX85_12740 [Stellaceae bacterium]|nr:hypothetical protein [Stellaceae bacterium]
MSLGHPWRAAALALAFLWGSAPAFAADQVQPLTLSGGAPLPDTAPAPTFHFDFLLDDPARQALLPPGSTSNLEISLTSPNNSVFHFLFSPRPQFGFATDTYGVNRSYAGLSWNLFDSRGLYGNLGLGGTYDTSSNLPNDPLRRSLTPPLMLHGGLELGFHFGEQHSLSLRLDEGVTPGFHLNSGETSDNFRLRYGLKF